MEQKDIAFIIGLILLLLALLFLSTATAEGQPAGVYQRHLPVILDDPRDASPIVTPPAPPSSALPEASTRRTARFQEADLPGIHLSFPAYDEPDRAITGW